MQLIINLLIKKLRNFFLKKFVLTISYNILYTIIIIIITYIYIYIYNIYITYR